MPIRAENKARYPADWKAISLAIRNRAGWRCEQCGAWHGEEHPVTGSIVVLTTSHTDHQPENCDPSNLRALCQRCHLNYDRRLHIANGRQTRRARMQTPDLLDRLAADVGAASD